MVLVSRLRAALDRLNPALPPEAVAPAILGALPIVAARDMAIFAETAPVARPGILFEWLTEVRCKYWSVNESLFE